MSKKHAIKLTVPNPCSEDWNGMTPNEEGRFCLKCNKTVIDFSTFSDKELYSFFLNSKGSFCGNFNSYQLEKLIRSPEPANGNVLHKLFLGASLAAGVAATAQNNNKLHHRNNHIQTPTALPEKNSEYVVQPADTTDIVIANEPLKPLPFINNSSNVNIRGGGVATQYIIEGKKATPFVKDKSANKPKNQ